MKKFLSALCAIFLIFGSFCILPHTASASTDVEPGSCSVMFNIPITQYDDNFNHVGSGSMKGSLDVSYDLVDGKYVVGKTARLTSPITTDGFVKDFSGVEITSDMIPPSSDHQVASSYNMQTDKYDMDFQLYTKEAFLPCTEADAVFQNQDSKNGFSRFTVDPKDRDGDASSVAPQYYFELNTGSVIVSPK